MLVLTRQRDETIIIGDDIEITVVDIRGDKVRLGINAPKRIPVHRKEVYEQIRRENRAAAMVKPSDLYGIPPTPPPPRPVDPYPRLAETAAEAGDEVGGAAGQPASAAVSGDTAAAVAQDVFLRAAIEEARQGLAEGGVPIGAVLVSEGKIIGRGRNRRVQRNNPMAHAEIECLTNAGRQKSYRNTILYSTLMPCQLCSGAVVQFQIPKVVVGEAVNFKGAPDLLRSKGVEVVDLHDRECIEMMSAFIRQHPELWNEDIGR